MDLSDLKKYKIERKTSVELAREKISDSISIRLAETLGLNDLYHLGCISILHMLLSQIDQFRSYNKEDLIAYLKGHRSQLDVNENVKGLIDKVLEEFK